MLNPRRMPPHRRDGFLLAAACFLIGAMAEYSLIKVGFYKYVQTGSDKILSSDAIGDDQFWDRVQARRQIREQKITIQDPVLPGAPTK